MLPLGLERRKFLKVTPDRPIIEKLCPDAPVSREPGAFPALGYHATAAYPDGSFITVYFQRWGKDKKTSLVRTLWRFK
jgi:hypothetical protein